METFAYTLLAFIIILFGLKFALSMAVRRKVGKEAPGLKGTMGKSIQSGSPSLFYFYSPMCGPCRNTTPEIEKMQKDNPHVYKIDISEDMDTAKKFGIMGTPSYVFIKGGKILDVMMGPRSSTQLSKLLKS